MIQQQLPKPTADHAQDMFVSEMKAMVTHHNHRLGGTPHLSLVLRKLRKMKPLTICKNYVANMRESFSDFSVSSQEKIIEHARSRKLAFLNDIAFNEMYDLLNEEHRIELLHRTIDLVVILKSLNMVKNPLFAEFADLPAKYASMGVSEDKIAGQVINDLFCDQKLFEKVASIMTSIPNDPNKKKSFLEVTEAMGLIKFENMVKLQNQIDQAEETNNEKKQENDNKLTESRLSEDVATIHVAEETTATSQAEEPSIADLMFRNRSDAGNSDLQDATTIFASLSQKQEDIKKTSEETETDLSGLLGSFLLDKKEKTEGISTLMAAVGQNHSLLQKLAKTATDARSGTFSLSGLLDAAQAIDPNITTSFVPDFPIQNHKPLTQRYGDDENDA